MLGFATIDDPSGGPTTVWLTSRVARNALDASRIGVGHTNAVTIQLDDPDAATKVRSLLADRVVVEAANVGWLQELIDETREVQAGLSPAAIAALPPIPTIKGHRKGIPEHTARTLATANYVAEVWGYWLATADKLRQRDRSKERPADLPPRLSEHVRPERV